MQRQVNAFALDVLVDGVALKKVEKDGKTYAIVPDDFLANRRVFTLRLGLPGNGQRYEAVVGVDGRDTLTTRAAAPDARGIVYRAYGTSAEIKGWRLNDDETADFFFAPRGESYADATGVGANTGVIGVVFFSEHRQHVLRLDNLEKAAGGGPEAIGGACSASAGHDVGTGFGKKKHDPIGRTSFVREREVHRISFEYASETSLRAAGILKDPPLGPVDAFPGEQKPITGVTPPPGWTGG